MVVTHPAPKADRRRYPGLRPPARGLAAIVWIAVSAILCTANQAAANGEVVLEPVADADLAAILADSFSLPLLLGLEGRTEARADAELAAERESLTAVMTSLGYLDARVETARETGLGQPLRLTPVPGPLYRIGQLGFDGLPRGTVAILAPKLASVLSANLGREATAEVLGEIAGDVRWVLGEASFGRATVEVFPVRTDPGTRTAAITVAIVPGAPMTFGDVRFSGTLRMADAEAQALVPFRPGAPYSATAIEALRAALEGTGLFRRIRIDLAQTPDAEGRFAVTVEVRDIAPDPLALAASSGHGPTQLVLTMLFIVLLESVRVTSYWMHVSLRRALSVPVVLSVAASGQVVIERLSGFLR